MGFFTFSELIQYNNATTIQEITPARKIPKGTIHEGASGLTPPLRLSRNTPKIGPSSQSAGVAQFMRRQTKYAIGPISAMKRMRSMVVTRSNAERLAMDTAKIAPMTLTHANSDRSIKPMRDGVQFVANRSGHRTTWSSTISAMKSTITCRMGAVVGGSLNRSMGQPTHKPTAIDAKNNRIPGR